MEQERPLTPGEVAGMFGVSVVTVGAWADQGRLPHFRTPGGQRRFWRKDVEAFTRPLESTGGEAA
jgi:excisionase family DNA binding protein